MVKRVEPTVFIIGKTEIDRKGLQEYLKHIGAEGWETDDVSGVEEIIEIDARGCYKAFGIELNPNLTKVREGNARHLKNIIRSGDGSVLEHGFINFALCDISRVTTHEIVRHRVGTAISQESLRYVRVGDLGLWVPSCFSDEESTSILEHHFAACEDAYEKLLASATKKEDAENFVDLPMAKKKEYTSAARRVLPIGMATNMTWSCNVRSLRTIIEQRTASYAEEEIRVLFNKVGEVARSTFPNLFVDYDESFNTEYRKV